MGTGNESMQGMKGGKCNGIDVCGIGGIGACSVGWYQWVAGTMDVFAFYIGVTSVIVSHSLLGWGLGRCVSFVVCIVVQGVVLGMIIVAGAMWLGLVAMGVSKLICLCSLGSYTNHFLCIEESNYNNNCISLLIPMCHNVRYCFKHNIKQF